MEVKIWWRFNPISHANDQTWNNDAWKWLLCVRPFCRHIQNNKIFKLLVRLLPFLVWGVNGKLPSTWSSGFLLSLSLSLSLSSHQREMRNSRLDNEGRLVSSRSSSETFQKKRLVLPVDLHKIYPMTYLKAKWIFRQARRIAFSPLWFNFPLFS